MKIKRVLNNNAVISSNSKHCDVLLLGSGIAFHKKAGEDIDVERVEKTFLLKDKETQNRFTELMIDVPMEHILLSERMINYAKIKLGKVFNEIIYVNLTDHVHSAIERYQQGIHLKNPLKWDIKRFYPDEYAIGKKALDVIKKEMNIQFDEDEAAFIAIHFVNAGLSEGNDRAYDVAKIVKEVEDIVKTFYHTEFDDASLDYYRFITHLKFFAQRLLNNTHYDEEDEDFLEVVKRKYQKAYECAECIKTYIEKEYQYHFVSSELLYLSVHINRIVKNL